MQTILEAVEKVQNTILQVRKPDPKAVAFVEQMSPLKLNLPIRQGQEESGRRVLGQRQVQGGGGRLLLLRKQGEVLQGQPAQRPAIRMPRWVLLHIDIWRPGNQRPSHVRVGQESAT